MKYLLCLAALMFSGCSAYTQVEMNLVEQARKGVSLCQESAQGYAMLADDVYELQRRRLDQAFDADVKAQSNLSANWVIDHRKAYAVAAEALNEQHVAIQQNVETQRDNLRAVDAALQKLAWLESIQNNFFKSVEVANDGK